VAPLVNRLHPLEQLVVQKDVVLRGRELRGDGFLDLLKLVVRVRARQAVEDHLHAGERLTASLQRDDRVVERRLSRVVRDLLDFRALLPQPFLESGLEVVVADLVEGRRVERQLALAEQGVLARGRARPLG